MLLSGRLVSFCRQAVAGGIFLAASTAALADDLAMVTTGKLLQTRLSDGLPNEPGQWRTRVQVVFNNKSQRIERRVYEYFDPVPARELDIVRYPQNVRNDKPGRVNGTGRLVWRE